MSDGEIATALIFFGAMIGLRFDVFAVLLLSVGVIAALVTRGVAAGDPALSVVFQAAIGAVLLQVSYLAAAMFVALLRRAGVRLGAGGGVPRGKDR